MAEEEAEPQPSESETESPTKPKSPLHLMLTSIADERKRFFFGESDSGWYNQ